MCCDLLGLPLRHPQKGFRLKVETKIRISEEERQQTSTALHSGLLLLFSVQLFNIICALGFDYITHLTVSFETGTVEESTESAHPK